MKIDGLLVQIRSAYIHLDVRGTEPQLGQYYIAEYAHQNGFNVKVKSYSSNDAIVSSLIEILTNAECRIIGFYTDSENIWHISRVAMALRQALPEIFIVVGGPQITGDPHLAMKRIPYADCGIIGEGERPFSEILAHRFNSDCNLTDIHGLILRSKSNELLCTSPQIAVRDLDVYPYPRRYEYTLDEDVIFDQIITGRGCIGHCAFCYEGNKKSNHLRLRSEKSVIEEIDYIVSNLPKTRYISFLDDTFILNRKRTESICSHLINKYEGRIGWFCEARVDILIKNLDILPLLKKAGLIRIQLGGESGDQQILDSYEKNMRLPDLESVIKAIYNVGITSVYINFIVGGAFENLDSFNKTLEFARRILNLAPGCAEVGSSLLTAFVGTPIRNAPRKYGLDVIDYDVISGIDGHTVTVKTEELSSKKISQLKSIFDSEIRKEYERLVRTLSDETLLRLYQMNAIYGLQSDWYIYANTIESNKNYFEPQVSNGFLTFPKLMERGPIQMAVPYRTVQPLSDGEKYYAFFNNGNSMLLEGLTESVFLLSSGKLSYWEIIAVLHKKYPDIENIEKEVNRTYYEFDSKRLVIWKYLF